MMWTSPDTLWVIAQARQDELLKEIQLRQMQRQVVKTKRNSPNLRWRRLSGQIGGTMIAVGHRLQAHQPLK